MDNEFSVYHYGFEDVQVAEKRFVSADEAMRTVAALIRSPAAQIGVMKRIIVTDGGDFTNFEWKYGEGITFPPELVGKEV